MLTKPLYTVREVAELLKVKEATVRGWMRRGILRGVHISREWRIAAKDLEAFVEAGLASGRGPEGKFGQHEATTRGLMPGDSPVSPIASHIIRIDDIDELTSGYHEFVAEHYAPEAELYRQLAHRGQSPKTMVISCCDSRVDPSRVFNAGPGALFVVRNVANLVPPYEPVGFHGTSAAIEFAVTGLHVENIIVMGHARCGGIRAFLERFSTDPSKTLHTPATGDFIGKWMSLLRPAWGDVAKENAVLDAEQRQVALEHAGIRLSIENLQTFPFVKDKLARREVCLSGAYFDIATGQLQTLDPQSGRFEAVTQ
ncbi:MAG: carbonic anhydrase [Hyphomicrobiaceae bacterium]